MAQYFYRDSWLFWTIDHLTIMHQTQRRRPSEDVPWSCCDPQVFRPCIHTGVKHLTMLSEADAKQQLTIYQVN